MKQIKAFIHRNRTVDVFHALKKSTIYTAIYHASISDVVGTLKPLDNREQNYSIELGDSVITEVKLTLICEDEFVNEAIALIRQNARTGQALAGWIY